MADSTQIVDAEFRVIQPPWVIGEDHPDYPGWQYTGLHDASGESIWYNPTPAPPPARRSLSWRGRPLIDPRLAAALRAVGRIALFALLWRL